jgi:hypothetical protein
MRDIAAVSHGAAKGWLTALHQQTSPSLSARLPMPNFETLVCRPMGGIRYAIKETRLFNWFNDTRIDAESLEFSGT